MHLSSRFYGYCSRQASQSTRNFPFIFQARHYNTENADPETVISMFNICTRDLRYQIEEAMFSDYAFDGRLAGNLRARKISPHPYRTALQRDRDRILHSRTFRRLKHKRQVFLINVGDHYRTRLTHTMEVAQLSRTIARAMCLNEDLTEAIALGHDVGHTPFGHLGEIVLDDILRGKFAGTACFPQENYGGFKHNYQSLRVLDLLEQKYDYPGLNLSSPVREGILKHTRLKRNLIRYPQIKLDHLYLENDFAATLEGQIVSIADEIAQRTHDLEDGIRAGFIELENIRQIDIVKFLEQKGRMNLKSERNKYRYRNILIATLVDELVSDVIEQSLQNLKAYHESGGSNYPINKNIINFSETMMPLQNGLNKFIYKYIIFIPAVQAADEQISQLVLTLFRIYKSDPEFLPPGTRKLVLQCQSDNLAARVVGDHIAGMTDNFAVEQISKLQSCNALAREVDLHILQPMWIKQ